jgi:hypothetical protein
MAVELVNDGPVTFVIEPAERYNWEGAAVEPSSSAGAP